MRTTPRSVLAVSAAACALAISACSSAAHSKVAKAGTSCLYQDGSGVPRDKVVINTVTIAQGQ